MFPAGDPSGLDELLHRHRPYPLTDNEAFSEFGPEIVTVRKAATAHRDFIGGETLAVRIDVDGDVSEAYAHTTDVDLDGTPARIALRPASV
ncbi:MAG: hypothetical protein ACE5EF_11790 [Dehalococcoidia bacterium]